MGRVRAIVEKRFPKAYMLLLKGSKVYRRYRSRERRKHMGNENPDRTIYVIRIRRRHLGLMGYYISVMAWIRYALERGYCPVVDMENYPNTYLADRDIGKENAWEYYFRQPADVSLSEVYKSRNVLLGNLETPPEADLRWFYENVIQKDDMEPYFDTVRDHMHFSAEAEKILRESQEKILFPLQNSGKKVLGVVCRGTDLIGCIGHSRQPSMEELLSETRKIMDQHGYQFVFVASDTDMGIRRFQEFFGKEKVLFNESMRFDQYSQKNEQEGEVLSDIHFQRNHDEYLKGMEYLTTVYLLSCCDALYGSVVGATVGALCMNMGRYERVFLYDKGVY